MSSIKNLLGNPAGYRLYFNERDSDVSIKVEHDGEKWQFPAHKLILSTMSDVFRTMLEADMLEKNSKVITIRDSTPYAVKQFLKYLYMGIVDFHSWIEALSLLKIAHKYSVQTLIHLCESYLVTNIVFSNACILYEFSRTYSLKSLKKDTRDFILHGGFIVSSTEGFFNLKSRSLECFLSNSLFNMENEGCILTCLREWAVCECSRKCVPLTRINILATMEPFMKYINWNSIPEIQRTFVPRNLVENCRSDPIVRKPFHFATFLQHHISCVKFVLELGTYHEEKILMTDASVSCVRFSVDTYAFLSGFRIVGLFQTSLSYMLGAYLILGRDDGKVFVQFNLNSLPWTRGALVGNCVWREMIAYLPYPIRLDPFSSYVLSLKSSRRCKTMQHAKWPRTRLETDYISTNLGPIHLRSHGPSHGITQLFLLPAPPYRNMCNRSDGD